MAAVPPGQPGLREPGDGPGAPSARRTRLISIGLAVLAGLAALKVAKDAGVVGRAAVPPLGRVGLATVAFFFLGGFGLTRLVLPPALRRYEWLWVLPVGACAVALEMTLLGFAAVPFRVSLAIVVAIGVVLAVVALRRRPLEAADGRPALRRVAWPVWVALLLAAIALVPLFRAGFATVEGQGQDAHLAVGSAIFLQRHYPTSVHPEEAVDRMPLVWRSKWPIYYTLGAVASLSGKEVFESISTLAAVLLGLAALGFFLLARETLRAPPWAALVAMALVGLDRMVLHTIMHPYFNQTWGFFAMPFAFVLAWEVAQRPTRNAVGLLLLFLAICGFAYPLALPIPMIPILALAWHHRARLRAARRVWRGKRSLVWMVPLGLLLLVPVQGVLEKVYSASNVVFNPGRSLGDWGGDLTGWFPEPHFFAIDDWGAFAVMAPVLGYGIWLALRDREPALRRGFVGVLAFAAVWTVVFRIRDAGWYFHFKTLAFIAPIALTLAAVGFARIPRRAIGYAAAAVMLLFAVSSAKTEVGQTFDELPKSMLALRTIDRQLPPGASIRLDVDPQQQNWVAFMLHGQPLCSQHPLLHTSYPHVAISRKAAYILTPKGARVPRDAAGGPVVRLEAWTLYRARPGIPGRDNCSQRMVQTVKEVTA